MPLPLTFGKHSGKTLEWVFFHDPGYVWWLEEQFHDNPGIIPHADRAAFQALLRQASHLQVPGTCAVCRERPINRMLLTAHAKTGSLAAVTFACDACTSPEPGHTLVGKPGFRSPDVHRDYDKSGGSLIVKTIKAAYFGDPSYRMTPARLDAFWLNPAHFAAADDSSATSANAKPARRSGAMMPRQAD